MSTSFPVLSRSDHKLLRSESCSGYTDVFGNWNTGFYCPQSESKAAVYCCGTETYKYCCTAKDPNDEGGVDASQTDPYIFRIPLIIGIVSGLLFIAFFVILATCYFCPCCLVHKKRNAANIPNGLYRLQCGTSSTTSPLVNLNSHSSNLNSFSSRLSTTPSTYDYGNSNFYGQHPAEQNFGPNPGPINGFHLIHPANSFSTPRSFNNSNGNGFLSNTQNRGNNGNGSNQNQYDHFNLMLQPQMNMNQLQGQGYGQGQQPIQNGNTSSLHGNPNRNSYYSYLDQNEPSPNVLYNSDAFFEPQPPPPRPASTRCRASYGSNELTGSPCFSNAQLVEHPEEVQTINSTISNDTSSTTPYNYSYDSHNSGPGAGVGVGNSRNSFTNVNSNSNANAFSTSNNPQVYTNSSNSNNRDRERNYSAPSGRNRGGEERLLRLPDFMCEPAENKSENIRTAGIVSPGKIHGMGASGVTPTKSVHFADRNPCENETKNENEESGMGLPTGNEELGRVTTFSSPAPAPAPAVTVAAVTPKPKPILSEVVYAKLPPKKPRNPEHANSNSMSTSASGNLQQNKNQKAKTSSSGEAPPKAHCEILTVL